MFKETIIYQRKEQMNDMRKQGRKKYEFNLTEKDIVFVYDTYTKVQNKVISKKEASDILSEKYGISVPTCYRIFTNMYVMELLIQHNVDEELLQVLDKELKVLDVIRGASK